MTDAFYNLGQAMVWAIPLIVALFCINRIRKNRIEIKKMEEENRRNGK